MRLSLLFFVAATVALLSSVTAESANGVSHRLLRSASSPEELRGLKAQAVDESDDSEDLTEERGGNGLSSAAAKWKKIRTSVRLKELQEALAIAKMEVKAAALAAAQAATKAKQMEAVSKFLDDAEIVTKMAKDATYRTDVYKGWHNMGIEPEIVFKTIAESGKYTGVKWYTVGEGYLNHLSDIARAAAKKTT
ncbi:hypothetical protein PHYSODRAFT_285267 [Phytophthora sojae]|uniref:Uncharacterized protein n=2 Tax=Phytophthora sojae TaxID=67593 RepID=G4Z3G5_PHYSP|nr:hypothetical protein PHYSODRAFT_285267 [Phytophthora sojae]AEK81046.1 Avh256 [Phytophthora sojae]AEK81047.1 Avh256 [Phytophthora sojae]AEK81048.1 Avh256 [Phytophthora sojae]EGZ19337.1 hypothetical protein PHYSODRAFT_285267 [Phytophthora sojae]|eukprot:XP_009522054.1 hypothetical protein PHYSODRAFT_285267 [Phytophthora sojae]